MTSVTVILPIGPPVVFLNATADLFTYAGDLLTISDPGTGEAVCPPFAPDEWESVTVYGSDGYPDFHFSNPSADVAFQAHQAHEVSR